MPSRPSILRNPRIGVAPGRLELRREYETKRRVEKPWRALYKTPRWQAIRADQFAREPLCRMCSEQGRVVVATVCDHVVRHGGDEVRFFAGPFQSLCARCHDGAKQRAERAATRA